MARENNYASRTDSVPTKLRLFEAAYRSGNLELAQSLAESLKDTLACERQLRGDTGRPGLEAANCLNVADLPAAWAAWARPWSFCKVLALDETTGLARTHEPIELLVSCRADQVDSLAREVRLARVEENTGRLREVPCQVHSETRRGNERRGRVVFFADAPAHQRAVYLLFHGNPAAELPDYPTDLQVRGEGYGLDIENAYFVARLSRQMGQLERLTYKGLHGLELYAGGEGHGEPPNIDWAHDYLASGGFQKFRVTNWANCPNYEVVRGPLCTIVRRWGFPHSPIHPLFTPSRMHVSVAYTFFANTPYFLKQGSMEAVTDFELNYLRDDEWVFSGYSFTDTLWMGPDGKLHEGAVPAGQQDNLWGVGFFNRTSRDAFVALWLEHRADRFGGPFYHSGAPSLHYRGHGQVWSRWAVRGDPQFQAGAALRQRNAYLVLSYAEKGGAAEVEGYRQRLLHPLSVSAAELPKNIKAISSGSLARPGETGEAAQRKKSIWAALRECKDTMLYTVDANVVDMGYIVDVHVRGPVVRVLMTMPHRGRPRYDFLAGPMRERLLRLPGVREVIIEPTWNPPWSPNLLTDAGRKAMGLE